MRTAIRSFICMFGLIASSQHSGAEGRVPRSGHCGPVAKALAPLLPTLRAGTQVPLRLPTAIPFADRDNPVYASVMYLGKSAYDIELSWAPDCAGANSCRFVQLHGVEGRLESKQNRTSAVVLRRGVLARFSPATCGGAGCTDATLSWTEGKFSYSVDMKGSDEKYLLQMARSICRDEAGP
jgi:hypothetical protein